MDAMPERSMSFIVKTCAPEAERLSFSRVEIADADEDRVLGADLRKNPPIRDSSAGSGPSSDASGMPCTLPLVVVGVRVDVAVRVDPDQSERSAVAPHEVRRRRDRP